MQDSILLSLWITLIGMGSVFAAILVLWAAMAILVRVTKEQSTAGDIVKKPLSFIETEKESERKGQAAAAAVAYLLYKRNGPLNSQPVFPLPPTAIVSAWQAVMRANIFSKRGRVR